MGEQQRGDPGTGDPTATRRVLVREAARLLGISEDAVRMRVKRGTLEAEKRGGRLYVLLMPDSTTDQTADPTGRPDELVAHLREEIAHLREESRRKDHLLAAALERIPALEAPSETRETPETSTAEPEGTSPRPDAGGAQTAARRPWWRRWFG